VYVAGRSVRGAPATPGRPETIEETAEMVRARGGMGIPVRVDHAVTAEVAVLFARIQQEQHGRLDVLVNNISGDLLSEWDIPFWHASLAAGLLMQEQAVHTHVIASYYAAPLMVARRPGLIVEVTDGVDYTYRGNLFYSLAKVAAIHLAAGMAADLRSYGVTALAVSPGFMRSETMLDNFGVTEANWRDGIRHDPHFGASETPYYLARGVRALAADPAVAEKSGKALGSWDLAREYDFTDLDGSRPHWAEYFAAHVAN